MVKKVSIPLGRGTNNIGEVFALGLAFDLVRDWFSGSMDPRKRVVYFITDSTLAVGTISDGWEVKSSTVLAALARAARKSWKRLQGEVEARLLWIKSHSGVEGNELADVEAGRASSASKDGDGERVANVLRFHSFSLPP